MEESIKVVWNDACESVIQTLKDHLTSDAVLRLHDLAKEFILRTAANNTGIGAVILQKHDGVLFPVANECRKLSNAKRNYGVSEKECLAIVFGISRFKRYFYGRQFVLKTDHQALSYLVDAKHNNGRLFLQ